MFRTNTCGELRLADAGKTVTLAGWAQRIRKMGITPDELATRLEKQGLIEGRLMRFYDTLHTQSADYVADDIIETLRNYESE